MFYQWLVASLSFWKKHDKWASYRFVKNLDREFLPIHTKRVMDLLARIPVHREFPDEYDNELDIESQEQSIASQDLSYLQNMIHTLEQQSKDRETRHAKYLAQFNQEMIGNVGRQDYFLVQIQHQKAREEEVLAQIEQKIAERKARHNKFLTQFGRNIAERKARRERLVAIARQRMAETKVQDERNLA